MRSLENFILEIPYLFLKKIPYGWFGVVLLWAWPPIASGIIAALVLLGLLMMKWQNLAWLSKIRREHHRQNGNYFLNRPRPPLSWQARNVAILLAISAVLGWLLDGRIGLTGLQWFLLVVGFTLLYKDTLLLGAATTYVVTEQGIGIHFIPGHIDYRLFIRFDEIAQTVHVKDLHRLPEQWSVFAPRKQVTEGLLLSPRNRSGFSKMLEQVLIAPTDADEFLRHIPPHLVSRANA